jgi:hypothetical protein
MEYHIDLPANALSGAQLAGVEDALLAQDSGAAVDLHQGKLRISTLLRSDEVRALLRQEGCEVEQGAIYQVPSTCCGSCSG